MFGYLAPPLIGTVFCLILIPLVLRKHVHTPANRWFALYLTVWSVYGIIIFALRYSSTLDQAYYWEKAATAIAPLMGLCFYKFSLATTNSRGQRWFLGLLTAGAIFFAVISRTDLVVTGMQRKFYGYAPVGGVLWWPWVVMEFIGIFVALGHIWRSVRSVRDPDEKNRLRYILAGMSISVIGGAFDVMPLLGLPAYPGAVIGNIIFCLLTSFAIVRYHLLDVNIIILRGAAYLLMSMLVALPYTGFILLFYWVFNQAVPVWASIIFLVLVSLVLQPGWRRIQIVVDRLFFRERYDFLRELEQFSQDIHNISSIKQISSPFVRLLQHALQASSVHLLLPDETGDFATLSSIGEHSKEFKLEKHSPLLSWLRTHDAINRQDMQVNMQLQSLTQKEDTDLKKIKAELFFPLKSKSGDIIGLLVLGEKLSGDLYSQSDKSLLLTVTGRMAVELENAVLYAREKAVREELQKQNQQKSEFLHQVAHELKTPLTAIISSSELLAEDFSVSENNPHVRLVNNISHSAWSMDKRITELLDYARMQSGNLRINIQDLDVHAVLAEITSALEVLFRNKDQAFSTDIEAELPKMRADRDRLEQIVINLLSNANKFSPNSTSVELRAKADKGNIVFEVEDSAPSIGDIEKSRLFEPYYRGEDADKRQRLPGLGLGLAISRKLVELQNGQMWIVTQPGKGNIFCFSMPAVVPAPPVEANK